MAKKKVSRSRGTVATTTTWRIDGLWVLQAVVAVFLITLGLIGIVYYDSNLARLGRELNRVFGQTNNPFNLIVAIVELVAGILVLAALFVLVRARWLYVATLVIAIVWAVRILLDLFISNIFEPDFLVWLNRLAGDLILLLALWLINRKYA